MFKKLCFAFAMQIGTTAAFAQHQYMSRDRIDQMTDSIQTEGKALYRSEWASWYGTDIFMEKCNDKRGLIGGYVSYETPTGLNNVFFTKKDSTKALATISFGKDFDATKFRLDTTTRKLTSIEMELVLLRKATFRALNSDTTFKRYKNASFNVVPYINKGVKRVYVLTSSTANNVVAFGNDYLVDFNIKNEITGIKRIHNSLIASEVKPGEKDLVVMHTHLAGKDEFMSATDICTLMLYGPQHNLSQCYVMSKNYISIWECKKQSLYALTMDAWERINKDQTERHPKN